VKRKKERKKERRKKETHNKNRNNKKVHASHPRPTGQDSRQPNKPEDRYMQDMIFVDSECQ